jgi:hypothetical protein
MLAGSAASGQQQGGGDDQPGGDRPESATQRHFA